ncbi:MAG: hypothetical protein ACD_30C00112G0023 [uncultured bacterium]|uniref:CAAX prenyl protease 2/Lysostaphin resistance protein A-like domain-containing protein n=4 Tax=Candidatus Daviesiibacteriota TaxID=1752718 RepID=A0A0G0EYG8_9BACT|nr:MAG: hypothetical protein ACD_30C00112G0023 [uncultured bacterium]KKQ10557.1 MAG: hypothetical protein US19_C0003G0052 [Candidatus Daviesbacteria bacterium GW2011_GWB1_36_5]KKQ15300.1 MAG: hypothetical protein US28_C0019G0033 [Candidatus Daviesbacteria bacterium GW2011_GWA1_36_8]OGE17182.1 MAG: hypothetical protein A2858_00565 [Candidatus Daviesbacteria bacterium RIFCSPHIGHO2_01_FULL_36_37]OGE35963.1 MAG: hypothetical protein A3E66_01560 [Candidatus Daviesbacteria bacterium RIFCSPHIGHO2_12_F
MQKIKNYLEKTKSYSTLRFILEMTFLAFLLKILLSLVVGIIFTMLNIPNDPNLSFETELLKFNPILILIFVVFFASFETITSQWFILWLSSKFTKSIFTQIMVSSTVFGILHFDPAFSIIVIPIGMILAWSFLIYRKKSLWSALWVTTAIHILHNLAAAYLLYLSII